MIDGLREWWSGRTGREHILLGVLGLLIGAMLAWFTVWRPVNLYVEKSRITQSQALDRLARTQAMVAEAKIPRSGTNAVAIDAGAVITQSAIEAGFTLTTNELRDTGQHAVAIGAAKSGALFAWLGALERQGIIVQTTSIRANGDGSVSFEATLRGRGA